MKKREGVGWGKEQAVMQSSFHGNYQFCFVSESLTVAEGDSGHKLLIKRAYDYLEKTEAWWVENSENFETTRNLSHSVTASPVILLKDYSIYSILKDPKKYV